MRGSQLGVIVRGEGECYPEDQCVSPPDFGTVINFNEVVPGCVTCKPI